MTDGLQAQLDRMWSIIWRSEWHDQFSQRTLSLMWTAINCQHNRLRHGHVQVLDRRIVYDYLVRPDLESAALWTRDWSAKRVLQFKPLPEADPWSLHGCKIEFERDLTLLMLRLNLDELPDELPHQR